MWDRSSVWFLLLLLAVPIVAMRFFRSDRRAGVRFSRADAARSLEPTWRQRTAWLLPFLRLLGLTLLIVSLARPREGLTQRLADAEGIAIQLVVDRSGSMDHDDYQMDGEWITRLGAVKSVATRFIAGDETLPGRPNDMIGLVTFARFAQTVSPLTLDQEFLLAHLAEIEVVSGFRNDGTAIGEGLALAVANLQESQPEPGEGKLQAPIKKVVILLTDGENNAGDVSPQRAAEIARMFGVRVYVIAVRPTDNNGELTVKQEPDQTQLLRQIAQLTDGQFFAAADYASLERIYQEIDRLERTPFAERHYTDFREWAIEPFRSRQFVFPPLALAALVLLSMEMIASRTFYLRCP